MQIASSDTDAEAVVVTNWTDDMKYNDSAKILKGQAILVGLILVDCGVSLKNCSECLH